MRFDVVTVDGADRSRKQDPHDIGSPYRICTSATSSGITTLPAGAHLRRPTVT